MCDLTNPIYTDHVKAREHLEAIRWPDGPVCPFCDRMDTVSPYRTFGEGWHHCRPCRKKFTVRVGSIYERSKVGLHKWILATHLMAASKKGISAHQLHRMLGVTYKTAWFMAHRIREAMKETHLEPMGGPGSAIQADETYFGHKKGRAHERARKNPAMKAKRAVVSLVSGGKARTFHVKSANARTVRRLLVENASRESELHTDESRIYTMLGEEFAKHRRVVHFRGQYVGPHGESTNACEN